MGTKLKVNFYSIGFKILAFLLLLAGIFAITKSILKNQDIYIYFDIVSYIKDNSKIEANGLQHSLFSSYLSNENNSMTSEEKIESQNEVNKYLDKGFCYFFIVNDKPVFYDGRTSKLDNLAENFAYESNIYDGYFGEISSSERNVIYESQNGIKYGTLYIIISDDYITAAKEELQPRKDNGLIMLYIGISGIALTLLGMTLLALLAGRKKRDGEIEFKYYDKIYADVFLILYLFSLLLIIVLIGNAWNEIGHRWWNYFTTETVTLLTYSLVFVFAVLTAWITTNFSKRVKAGSGFRYTLLYRLITKASLKAKIRIIVILLSIVIIYDINVIIMYFNSSGDFLENLYIPEFVMSIFLISLTIVFIIASRAYEFEEIKKGSSQIRNGNLSYKIPGCKNAEINQVADDINNMGEGLNTAVQKAISSEKLKTEMITNVSHDLKTPLTSIIRYIELLDEEKNLSAEAKDYISVLKTKSERLKNIISDLFDLSKSASGNSELIIEKLDLKKLVVQTLADMDDKVVNSGHVVKQSLPENEVFINADGKKLYRVFQNVIDNALKYALEGTRIFIDLKVVGSKAIVEIHNTASYEMDFTEQEILERFTRGDKSRTTDGTGLGLSIAETFTKACGGDFNIKIDGDQFRVIIEFNTL